MDIKRIIGSSLSLFLIYQLINVQENGFVHNYLSLVISGILVVMFLPLVIAFGYQYIMKLRGVNIHEGNSGIFSLFWISIITIPFGFISIIILLIKFWNW